MLELLERSSPVARLPEEEQFTGRAACIIDCRKEARAALAKGKETEHGQFDRRTRGPR